MSDQPSNAVAYTRSQRQHQNPREKLARLGAKTLSNTDLLSLVIGSEAAAARLVRKHGINALEALSIENWQTERGVGKAGAVRLCAVFELGRRVYGVDSEHERPSVQRPVEAFKQVRNLAKHKKEHLVGLYLDAQNGLLHKETISIGSLNTTRTHPREIMLPAVESCALGFILAHNHPSGCLDPSTEDIEFTRAVQRASELMGIELYDHLIVSPAGYTSMRERGLL